MQHVLSRIVAAAVISGCCAASVTAQDRVAVDLLARVKPQQHSLRGDWTKTDNGLRASGGQSPSLCVVPYNLDGAYELKFEFTRRSGTDLVGMVLPLQQTQVFLEFSAWSGEAHGLSRVRSSSSRDQANPTSVMPGTLVNGRRYRAAATVRPDGKNVTIRVALDDKSLIDWSGPFKELSPNLAFNIPSRQRLALAASRSTVDFHTLTAAHAENAGQPVTLDLRNPPVTSASPIVTATMKTVPQNGGRIGLTNVVWKDRRGTLEVVPFQGEQVVRLTGEDDTVALLPGSSLGDGEIDVEIASDIFSGIAFRAADVDNYDLVYFRPQNSGTARHKNTVQYVCKGRDGADWRTLRSQFPGKYESGARIRMNEWFRVRLVLRGRSVSVFVDDGEQSVLVVDKLLGERPAGAIGLWGWRSHFRNFSFAPARPE